MRERPVGKDFSPTHQACRQYAIGRLRSTPLRAALPHCTIRVQRQIWSGPVVHQNLGRSRSATPQFRHENPGETEASATRICAVAVRQCIAYSGPPRAELLRLVSHFRQVGTHVHSGRYDNRLPPRADVSEREPSQP
jgi:hypothetical protein